VSPVPAGPLIGGRTLRVRVFVQDGAGLEQWFDAGTVPPDWAASLLTNPDLWEDEG
jgi:hypothetical protein